MISRKLGGKKTNKQKHIKAYQAKNISLSLSLCRRSNIVALVCVCVCVCVYILAETFKAILLILLHFFSSSSGALPRVLFLPTELELNSERELMPDEIAENIILFP
jgi:hypothetical protein